MTKPSNKRTKRADLSDRAVDSLHVDGNAAAGVLSEIFAADLTIGRAKCAGCGTTRAVGALHVYSHGMGLVVRCPSCAGVVLRVARTPTHLWLDARGAVSIAISTQN
jgi:NAD-dependent SIR2 family protein deacetylase